MDPQNHPSSARLVSSPPSSASGTRAVLALEVQFNSQKDKMEKSKHMKAHLGLVLVLWYAMGCLIIARQCFSQGPRGWLCVYDSWQSTTRSDTQVCLFSSFLSRGSWQCVYGHSKASPCVS